VCSADEDTIKVWDFEDQRCLATWKPEHGQRVKRLAASPDGGMLVSVTKDSHNRDVLTIWDLSTISQLSHYQPRPKVVASQINQFNILCIKFAPESVSAASTTEPSSLQLCSCGQENIRLWRLKQGVLRSGPVVLDKVARNTVFTALDFDGTRRVYVGSKEGTVLQVNAESQELEFVFKLHDSGIHSLAVNEAFCVTGSDDQYLRVWPLDFAEFFMEAKHEATILAVDIAPDGVEIACATGHGSIGVLDISKQTYRTLTRAHTDEVLALHALQDRLVTVSRDKTIRVWSLGSLQQAYEFLSFDDQALSVSLHPSGLSFVCGFESGTLRFFDVERTAVTHEYRYFDKPLSIVRYLPAHDLLVAVAQDGSLLVLNATTHHIDLQLPLDLPALSAALAVDQSESAFATLGRGSTVVSLWDPAHLDRRTSFGISTPNSTTASYARGIAFKSAKQLVVLTADAQLRLYSVEGKFLVKSMRKPVV
jgi:WD40 repeat protein